jgi:FkbM family methyltransferase
MGNKYNGKYETTNDSWQEVFGGCYALDLTFTPRTILDLGANEGAFSVWASKKWDDAEIFAFEPIPENAARFRKNINGNPNVKFSELAIAQTSPARMYYGRNNYGECSLYQNKNQTERTLFVRAMPAEELPSCEFVKVDVEGAELDIITRLDLSKTRALVFEYHNLADAQNIINRMGTEGFENIEHCAYELNRGVMKFARPGAVVKPERSKPEHVRVFIGVPSFFHIDPHFHRCLMMAYGWLATQPDVPGAIHGLVEHSFGDSPHVGRARNALTRNFLESDCTDLLFIDSDIIFSTDHVKRILSHPEEVVGGIYYKKIDMQAEACLNTIAKPILKPNGLNQVAYIGTGFLRVKRIVFEKIIERWGDEMAYCPDGSTNVIEYNFWNLAMHSFNAPNGIDQERLDTLVKKYKITPERAEKAMRTRWLSEDWWFCQKANELGFQVWADRRIILRHSGNILYPLKTQESELFKKETIYGSEPPASAGATTPASPLAVPAPA